MLKQLLDLRTSDFKKNFALIFSGTFVSVLISLLAAPWLSRLYVPREYGIFGLFSAVTAVAVSFTSFRLAHVIQIAEKKEDAETIYIFCHYLAAGVAFVALLLCLGAYFFFHDGLARHGVGLSILLIAPTIFLSGVMEINSIWLNRNKSFRSISANKVIAAAATVLGSVSWAYLIDRSFLGLFAGLLTGQVIAAAFLLYESRRFRRTAMVRERLRSLIKEFKDFPLFELPATLSNTAAIQLPVFMLGRFAGAEPVGHFNMSNRLLGMPSMLIGTAMGEVFRQRATEDYHKHGNCRPILVKTFLTLAFIGLFPLVTILLIGPWLFAFVLGEEWRTAGEYSRILAVLFFLRFCISPVTYVFYIANKQRQNLIGQIILLLCSFVPFLIGFYSYKSVEASLLLYSISYSLFYILYLALSFNYSKR